MALLLGTLTGCAGDLPRTPKAGALGPDMPVRAGGLGPADPAPSPFDTPALPRPDARVDEDYPSRVIRKPASPLPEHVPDSRRTLPGASPWPPSQRSLQGLDRDPFERPYHAPIGQPPCPAGMAHC